jgi:chromosome segregation ATPase
LRADTRGGQQSHEILKLKTQITKKDKIIANLKREQNLIKENHQILVRDLQVENSQKIQHLTVLLSDKEKTIAGLKADALVSKTKIQRLETLVAAKEKNIVALKVSNESLQNELNNARKLVDSLKKEKKILVLSAKKREDWAKIDRIRRVEQHFDRNVFNYNPAKPSYKGESLKAETPEDASSTRNFRKLFVFVGICYVAYKNPGFLVNLLRHISFYSLRSLRNMFTSSIFLLDIPLNMFTTKKMY